MSKDICLIPNFFLNQQFYHILESYDTNNSLVNNDNNKNKIQKPEGYKNLAKIFHDGEQPPESQSPNSSIHLAWGPYKHLRWLWHDEHQNTFVCYWKTSESVSFRKKICHKCLFVGIALSPKSSYVITCPPQFTSRQINATSPNSDQHQFSPNNIHMLPRGMVMRINKMITKEKMLWSVIKLSQLIL